VAMPVIERAYVVFSFDLDRTDRVASGASPMTAGGGGDTA
jgi:hypothetical protein